MLSFQNARNGPNYDQSTNTLCTVRTDLDGAEAFIRKRSGEKRSRAAVRGGTVANVLTRTANPNQCTGGREVGGADLLPKIVMCSYDHRPDDRRLPLSS